MIVYLVAWSVFFFCIYYLCFLTFVNNHECAHLAILKVHGGDGVVKLDLLRLTGITMVTRPVLFKNRDTVNYLDSLLEIDAVKWASTFQAVIAIIYLVGVVLLL